MAKFTKMEGTGNDYVYFDGFDQDFRPGPEEIRLISDRHFGVGGDGVVLVLPSDRAEARMRMFNMDGSSSAMCGNALRCVALLVYNKINKTEFLLETDVGIHRARIDLIENEKKAIVSVEIGAPHFGAEKVPFINSTTGATPMNQNEIQVTLQNGDVIQGFPLSMGNPHFVVYVDDPESYPVERVGTELENHPAFPERTNVEFVSLQDGILHQRTWERGSGETLSCGSGACATLVASTLSGFVNRKSPIKLRGGVLEVFWDEGDQVWLKGPARIVFEGEWTRLDSSLVPG